MRHTFLLALFCWASHAAVIRGVVLDRSSGRPLARAVVGLQATAATGSATQSARTDSSGHFAFAALSAGAYLVTASRPGYVAWKYGQKSWKAAGAPVFVEADGSAFLDIRLQRFGAVSGTVVDENEIGIPEQDVVAYLATRPPRLAGHARTDDRGVYRISGLLPGSYLLRSGPKELEDASGLLPTFHPQSATVADAALVEVHLDQEVNEINIHPLPGRLHRIRGFVATFPQSRVTVTLISDMGPSTTGSDDDGRFSFEAVPPGEYEISVQRYDPLRRAPTGTYRRLTIDSDLDNLRLDLRRYPEIDFRFDDEQGERLDSGLVQVFARRKNLSGEGPLEALRLAKGRVALAPGRWEFSLAPTPRFYASGFEGPPIQQVRRDHPEAWNEVLLAEDQHTVRFLLSHPPAVMEGVVNGPGHEPAAGAPVHLEPFDPDSGKRLGDLRTTRTDLRGRYRFDGLAPGRYRLLSTFDLEDPDPQEMGAAGAKMITISAGATTRQDLDLQDR